MYEPVSVISDVRESLIFMAISDDVAAILYVMALFMYVHCVYVCLSSDLYVLGGWGSTVYDAF